MTPPLPDHYVTRPCRGCGKQVLFVAAVAKDGKRVTVPLDPVAPVYVRLQDGEGGSFWAQDTSRELLVSHFATCSQANRFSGSARKEP
jgi:hypothetical protein